MESNILYVLLPGPSQFLLELKVYTGDKASHLISQMNTKMCRVTIYSKVPGLQLIPNTMLVPQSHGKKKKSTSFNLHGKPGLYFFTQEFQKINYITNYISILNWKKCRTQFSFFQVIFGSQELVTVKFPFITHKSQEKMVLF